MLIIRANKNKNDKAVILNDKSSVNNQNNEIDLRSFGFHSLFFLEWTLYKESTSETPT